MTAKEQLYEKLSAEYAAFIDGLKSAAPDKIIDSAYEKVFKEDIISCFEYGDSFSEKQIAAMLALEYPLDSLYRNWLDTDVSYMDDLSDTISSFATREAGLQNDIGGEEITAVGNEIINKDEVPTAQSIYGEIQYGDWVIAAANNDYRYLLGIVTAIDKFGTPEHDTDNVTDDVHVDFTVFDYSGERIDEIVEHFSELNGELRAFDNLSLDDVIMSPKMLICISNLSEEEITRMATLRQNCVAFCNCFPGAVEPQNDLHAELMERLNKNLADYHNSLMGFGKREIVDMAGKIAAMKDVYDYMTTTRGFDDDEMQFYLQFQNPLEVVADAWLQRNADNEDMSFSMDFVFDKKDALFDYPLMLDTGAIADNSLRRFMDVDLVDFLGKIAGKTIIHNPEDWQSQSNALNRIADTDSPENQRLIWLVSSRGAHLYSEQSMFIKETPAYEKCVGNPPNDPDLFGYIVEVTGRRGNAVMGNVFEVGNYADFANHVRLTALPLESITLKYSNDKGANAGKTITVPRHEYDNERQLLASQNGKVTSIQYNPSEVVRTMSDLLQLERSNRMAYQIGSTEAHLERLTDTLAVIRMQQPERPPADKKRSIGDRLAAGNEKVKAYKEQKAQTPENTTKHKKEDVLE